MLAEPQLVNKLHPVFMSVRVCALFSGGKDSTYALHWAVLKGFNVVCLITFEPATDESLMFHYPNIHITEHQARSLGLPRVLVSVDDEYESLVRGLRIAKAEYDILGVVSGALLSDYQRMMINMAAKEVGLRVYSPLWRKDQGKYMVSLVKHGFRFVLSSISTYGLYPELLGKVVDLELVSRILKLAGRYGFNPAFEGGEAETLVLDAPLFRFALRITSAEVVRTGTYSWVYLIKGIDYVSKRSSDTYESPFT